MKVIKGLLLAILALVIIALVTALFVKKEYSAEREVVINKPRREVFDYIRYLKNQDNYSKWNQMDPDMKKSYQGTDGTVGFIYAWDSEKAGSKGEQEIKNIVEGERLDCELRFEKPMTSTSPIYLITEEASENETLVKWGFKGTMSYPSNLMLLVMNFEEMVGSDLQTGLDNLKRVLEK